jgi:hypothetical protein
MWKSLFVLALTLVAAEPPASVEIRSGTAPVCGVVRQELMRNWQTFHEAGSTTTFTQIAWHESDHLESLPPELQKAQESQFDFDNDGTPDRVFAQGFEDHYMQGSVLLVQPGPKMNDSWFVPCQLDAGAIAFEKCPPFSQDHDEAGFSMRGRTSSEKILFRARYVTLTPFRLDGTTFLAVEGSSEDTRAYVGIIKPFPGKKSQPMCLLRVIHKR